MMTNRPIAGALACVVLLAPVAAVGVRLEVSAAAAWPGQATEVEVMFRAEGDEVAGVENVLEVGRGLFVEACRQSPASNKELQYRLTAGDSVKAIVIDFSDLSPIPDGVSLYACRVRVLAGSTPASRSIRCLDPGASDPEGTDLETTCDDAIVPVPSGAPPDSVATSTPWDIATPTRVRGTPRQSPTPIPTRPPSPTPDPRENPSPTRPRARPTPLPPATPGAAAQTILLQLFDSTCGSESSGRVPVSAFVFDSEGRPVNDVEVAFASPFGSFEPPTARTQQVGTQHGVATANLLVSSGVPARVDADGNILPYLIRATSGRIEGAAQLFVVPGRQSCGGSAFAPLGNVRMFSIATSPTRCTENGGLVNVQVVAFDGFGRFLSDIEVELSALAGEFAPPLSLTDAFGVARSTLLIPKGVARGSGDGSTESVLFEVRSGDVVGFGEVLIDPDADPCATPASLGRSVEDDGCMVAPQAASAWRLALGMLVILLLRIAAARAIDR